MDASSRRARRAAPGATPKKSVIQKWPDVENARPVSENVVMEALDEKGGFGMNENELRVHFIDNKDKSYAARLIDAGGNKLGVEAPFTPFLTEDNYEDLRWYLEDTWTCPTAARSPGHSGSKRTSSDGAARCMTPCSRHERTATS
jgi:hypothetical protein